MEEVDKNSALALEDHETHRSTFLIAVLSTRMNTEVDCKQNFHPGEVDHTQHNDKKKKKPLRNGTGQCTLFSLYERFTGKYSNRTNTDKNK